MDLRPIDLIGGFYQDDSLPWSAQDICNWIPEAAEVQGTRTPVMMRQAPGLRPYVRVGEGPIRGIRNVEGKLLVVSGNELYQVTAAGVAIPRGTIPGVGPVSMSHNQRGTTNQLLIANGAAGYVYDTSATTLTKITDEGYPGAFVVDFVDGYLPQIEPFRRYWFHSALRDALNYNTLDRYEAEGQPDPLVTLLVDHREVWVFGERTIEPYVNTGALTNTFQRASNTVIEHGCAAKFSPAKLDNSVFWLDELGIVRRSQGYTAVRVSTGPIEKAIAGKDWSRAFGFTMTEEGHAVYYLTFPDGHTFGYDIVTGLWHRRASYNLDRWRVSCVALWEDQYIAGDFQQGLLYVVDWDYPHDGILPNVRKRVTGVTHNNQNRVLIPYLELIAQTGEKIVPIVSASAQPTAPTISGGAVFGVVGEAYSHSYTLGGGAPPYVVSLRSGTLPAGLTLSSAGVLSGTPTTAGDSSFTVRVTDSLGLFDDLADGVTVVAAVMPALLTNKAHYEGSRSDLDPSASVMGWPNNFDRFTISPSGEYAVGSDANETTGTYIEFRKYDSGAGTWGLISTPAGLPARGPNWVAFHPNGIHLALVWGASVAAADRLVILKRSGDSFTAITAPTDALTAGGNEVTWNSTGTKLAVVQATTGDSVVVYNFDAGTDVIGTRQLINTVALGEQWNMAQWRPGDDMYIAVSGVNRMAILDVPSLNSAVSAAVDARGGIVWCQDTDYVLLSRWTAPRFQVYSFTDTPGSEALTYVADATGQPSGDPSQISRTSNGEYLASARSLAYPEIFTLTGTPPVVTKLTDPAATSAGVAFVEWSEVNL